MWKNTGQNKLVGKQAMKKNSACAKTIKIENTGKSDAVKKDLHRQMIIYGGEGKKLKNCCIV